MVTREEAASTSLKFKESSRSLPVPDPAQSWTTPSSGMRLWLHGFGGQRAEQSPSSRRVTNIQPDIFTCYEHIFISRNRYPEKANG
jgi:hypothetical protein